MEWMNKQKFKSILITLLAAILLIPSLVIALVCVIIEKMSKCKESYGGEGQPYPRIK